MKRKAMLLFLTAILSVNLATCGHGRGTDTSTSGTGRNSTKNVSTAAEEDEKKAEEDTKETEEKKEDAETAVAETEKKDADKKAAAAEEETKQTTADTEQAFETVTLESGDCSVTFSEIDPKGDFGYTVKVLLENNSSDKTYMYAINGAYANGLNAEPFFASEVAPGKKNKTDFTLDDEAVQYLKGDISQIQLYLRIYNTDDYDDVAYDDMVTLYPKGTQEEAVYQREAEDTDQVLVETDQVKVTFVKSYTDDIWGYTLLLYLENKTDSTKLMYAIDDCSVNDFMIDPYWATELYPDKTGYSEAYIDNESLEDNEITEVKDITFTLRVYDSDDWSADDLVKETINLKF